MTEPVQLVCQLGPCNRAGRRYRATLTWQLISIDALLNGSDGGRKACPPLGNLDSIECGRCGSAPRTRSRFGANGAPWRQASGSMAADAAVVRRGRRPPPRVRRPLTLRAPDHCSRISPTRSSPPAIVYRCGYDNRHTPFMVIWA